MLQHLAGLRYLSRPTLMYYYVTGVWKNKDGDITHLNLHLVDSKTNSFGSGMRMSGTGAIRLLHEGNKLSTIVWDYSRGSWRRGSELRVVRNPAGEPYLRTIAGNGQADNLDNLINMSGIG